MNYSVEEKICIVCGNEGVSATKFFQLWDLFDGAADLLANLKTSQVAQKLLGNAHLPLCKALDSQNVEKAVARLGELGVVAVTCFSAQFPQSLANIPDPPYVLFCRGNVGLLSSPCLAVVGTRKVTAYGRHVAKHFTSALCKHFTVVSGLAYGVDSIAHETTLEEGGNTIAVLGGGLIRVYPAAHQNLAERIVQSGGLLVSEYGAEATPQPYRFPHRNRIVSGLSQGLLVCQSPIKSGTSSTVECALDQGKDVFVVPGEIFDPTFAGNNQLIKSMQGVCVLSPEDIQQYYGLDSTPARETVAYQLTFDEQKVVEALADGQLSFDQLAIKTEISAADLNFLLANLEIKSIIARLPGNSYRLYGGIK